MDEFAERVLLALVEGFQARAEMKERNRALSEYEIARRIGYTDYSYVEFSTTQARDDVRIVLDELERNSWAAQWQRAGRYDTYVPTEAGVQRASALDSASTALPHAASPLDGTAAEPSTRPAPGTDEDGSAAILDPAVALTRMVQQLDEVLTLLRTIDERLGRER